MAAAAPVRRDGFSAGAAFSSSVSTLWGTFWSDAHHSFSENALHCSNNSFSYPSIWDLAVTGKAITSTGDADSIAKVTANCLQYRNPQGWFSASTARDNDVYVDDNAQVLWVFVEAYQKTGNQAHLQVAQTLMGLIQGQWVQKTGGVRWKLGAPYVASISTLEAGLSAARLYQATGDSDLLGFARQCTDWIAANLTDPDDGLIWDGLNSDTGDVNKGKLSYTVGVMLSTLAVLNQATASVSVLQQAASLARSAINPQGAFYDSSGYWNNPLSYSHLFAVGLVDFVTTTSGFAQYMFPGLFSTISSQVSKQAAHIQSGLQIADSGSYQSKAVASGNNTSKTISKYGPKARKHAAAAVFDPLPAAKRNLPTDYCQYASSYSLMDDASAAQIFFAASQLN